MLTALFISLLLAVLASPPTPRRIPPLIPALALVAVGFTALLEPGLALAQASTFTAPAASSGLGAQLLQALLDHVSLSTVVGVLVTLAGGSIGLSVVRKRQVALAIYHAFHIVEDISAEAKEEGKSLPWLDKATGGLEQVNTLLVAQGWRPLKPGEETVAKLTFKSMNAQADAKLALAQTATSVVLPQAPASPAPVAPAPTAEGSSHPQ